VHSSFDVSFANPCNERITIDTYSVPVDRLKDAPPTATAELEPHTITQVKRAFLDAAGFDWTAVVLETDHAFEIKGDAIENDTVVLPAESCPVT
jgi:hypothetical protein